MPDDVICLFAGHFRARVAVQVYNPHYLFAASFSVALPRFMSSRWDWAI